MFACFLFAFHLCFFVVVVVMRCIWDNTRAGLGSAIRPNSIVILRYPGSFSLSYHMIYKLFNF